MTYYRSFRINCPASSLPQAGPNTISKYENFDTEKWILASAEIEIPNKIIITALY